MNFKLGDKVSISGCLTRVTTRGGVALPRYANWSAITWNPDTEGYPPNIRRDWVPSTRIPALIGVVCGRRVLANGSAAQWYDGTEVWEPSGYSTVWMPDTYVTAYQVAHDLRAKPIHCLPEQLQVIA